MPPDHSRPVMLVTGASRGIGAAIARAAAPTYDVVVNYVADERAATALARELEGRCAVQVVRADVGTRTTWCGCSARSDERFGRLDVLVNNAGIAGGYGELATVTASMMARLLAVNVTGAFLCAREAAHRMSTANGGAGGSIVNLSSKAAILGGSGEWVHYAATKGAIDTMTVGLAKELAAHGIRVNGVRPGLIESDFHDVAPPGRVERMAPTIPMQRSGSPDEVARGGAVARVARCELRDRILRRRRRRPLTALPERAALGAARLGRRWSGYRARVRALIILADPDPGGGICRDAAARAGAALETRGHEVTIRDLRAEGFRATMNAVERQAYHGDRPIRDPLVEEHAALVGEANVLVFAYPTVLSTLPGVLKGWLERVLVPGVGFVLDHRQKVRPGLQHVRRIVGISTYQERRLDVKVTHDNGRRTITRAVRMSAGLRTRTAWVPLYSAAEATSEQREQFLDRCASRVSRR